MPDPVYSFLYVSQQPQRGCWLRRKLGS